MATGKNFFTSHEAKKLVNTYGGTTQPVYINNGIPTNTTYTLESTVSAGTANRLVYYSGANILSATDHYASASKIAINSTSEPTQNFYVNGTGYYTDKIFSNYRSGTWVNSLTNSAITLTDDTNSYKGWICGPTKEGRIVISTYSGNDNILYFGYGERGRTTNSFAQQLRWDGKDNIVYGARSDWNWLRVVNDSSANADDAAVYIQNQSSSTWGLKILKDSNAYGLYIDGAGTELLRVGSNSVLKVHDNASSVNDRTVNVNGLLKITANGNTATLGSQNTTWFHFYNSANIPFIFNNTVATTSGNLGTSTYRWGKLYVGTADSYGSSTQPVYWNAGVPTATTYSLGATLNAGTANRLAYFSGANAVSATGHYASTDKIAINSTSAPSYNLYVNGTSYFNGNTTHNGIDYFANGTTYYINNSAQGKLYQLQATGLGINATGTGSGLDLYSGGGLTTPTYGITFAQTSSLGTHAYVTGSWATYFTMNDDTSRGWIFRRGTTNIASVSGAGKAFFNSVVNTNGLACTNAGYVAYPQGAVYRTSTSTITGALCITLPVTWTNTMVRFKVQIFTYNGTDACHEYTIAGYNYSSTWTHCHGAYSRGTSVNYANRTVRFGHNGSKCCVYIGETNSTWSYPQVVITDVSGGYSNYTSTSWAEGWSISFVTSFGTITATNTNPSNIVANAVYGAVWNDYAEYRESSITEPGRCVREVGDDTLVLTDRRLQPGCEIVSDTFGFAIGETEECKTPIASSGRVLAYPWEDREEFRKHIGEPVCSGPDGTVSIMTPEEEMMYPSRIIGTISAVPDYEEWGSGNVKVNGRVWIRIR